MKRARSSPSRPACSRPTPAGRIPGRAIARSMRRFSPTASAFRSIASTSVRATAARCCPAAAPVDPSSLIIGGVAIVAAGQKMIDKATDLAARELEVASGDVEYRDGVFAVKGTDLKLGLFELAARSQAPLEGIAKFAEKQRELSVWLSGRGGRCRSAHGRGRYPELPVGRRPRPHHSSGDGRGPARRRHRPGARPGAV